MSRINPECPDSLPSDRLPVDVFLRREPDDEEDEEEDDRKKEDDEDEDEDETEDGYSE